VKRQQEIKCVVWDLDGTLWDGILAEMDDVKLRPGIKETIRTLDSRGILHSIASRNNYDDAMHKLKEFGLDAYFLYPEINWNAKSVSIRNIQRNLNIHRDVIMFIDDDPLEQDEVKSEHPEVTCLDASERDTLLSHPRLNPRFITEDSTRRRLMYLADIKRKGDESGYQGPKKEFLASLNIQLIISKAKEEDLRRAEELTVRTNQLNTTGRTYSYDDLKVLISSAKHRLLVCEMKDKYGAYGKIGLALVEITEDCFYLRLFLMSCRVMSLGVGTVLLSHIMKEAKKAGKKLKVDFRNTGRNRMMRITFTFANFREVESNDCGVYEDDAAFSDDDNIFELGFVDSPFAIQLICFIEEEFQIAVRDDDLDIENFTSVNRVVEFVSRKTQGILFPRWLTRSFFWQAYPRRTVVWHLTHCTTGISRRK
jgi:FkbH-like protein